MGSRLTFWEWLYNTQPIQSGSVVQRILHLLNTGAIPNDSNPETYEDVKDILRPLGFDREVLKEVRNLWSEFPKGSPGATV